jgi:putative acetyltransferase
MGAEPLIRPESPEDAESVRRLNRAAFEGPHEGEIVDQIRAAGGVVLSLVAETDDELVGHILFSEVTVGDAGVAGLGLAPMAVLPEYQNRGIGSALVRRGLELLRAGGAPFVVVLGHPAYYPRFGFVPASSLGLASEYEGVPDEAFMVVELAAGGLAGVSGIARYRPEFGGEVSGPAG